MLREEIQAYLDGEIAFGELPDELRSEARAWDGLLGDITSNAPAGAPLGIDARIMREIEEANPRRTRPAWWLWLLQPRTISVSPAGVLAAAAVITALVIRPWAGSPAAVETGAQPAHVYVQFSLEAPDASRVDLVGDFNEWAPTIALEDLDGDGVWTATVPLQTGVHEYMFVLDGADWVGDPSAELHVDDGFGQENSVVAIPAINGT